MIRVFLQWAAPVPLWTGVTLLAVGAVSAIGGVMYAVFEHDLKRLLALSSIENVGIIVMALGACLVFRDRGSAQWSALALAAALLHTVNHAVFKSLLFLAAGAWEKARATVDLDHLGGLLRQAPLAGGAFMVGAMAIAGVPPLNGFVSEWATLQVLVHLPRYGGFVDGLAGAAGAGALAVTAGLALFAFVKVAGLVLLGPPRSERRPRPSQHPAGAGAALAFLAGGCVALGVAPGLLWARLAALAGAPAGTARVGLSFPGTGGLPTPALAAVLVSVTAVLLVLRGRNQAEVQPTWVCGQPVDAALGWTGAGFTKPLRLALEPLLRPRREMSVVEDRGVIVQVDYRGEVPHLVDDAVYRPAVAKAMRLAAKARRLQSGSLAVYVGYLIGLVVIALVAAGMGLL
jgi:hydrogenase-4 component B